MPSRNIELARRAYEAWNRGDLDGVLDFLDPEIEWSPPEQGALAGTYRGRAEVKRFLESLQEVWEELRVEPEDFIEKDDQLFVPIRLRGRAKGTGIRLDERWAHLWTGSEGRAIRCRTYTDRRKAREALDLGE